MDDYFYTVGLNRTHMTLLVLKWKETFRAPQWDAKLSIKIIMGLVVLYFLGAFLFLASVIYPILFDNVLDREPLEVFNSALLYIFFAELVIRFFLQQLPVTNIQSLILLPITKSRIINHVLARSVFSGFNTTPLVVYLPFAVSMYKDDYLPNEVAAWWFALLLVTLAINFFTFLTHKSYRYFMGLLLFIVITLLLATYTTIDFAEYTGKFFDRLVETPSLIMLFFVFLVLSYWLVYFFMKRGFYLDTHLGKKKTKVRGGSMRFLDSLGHDAFILKNDLRMIIRNARPRQMVLMSFLFLFYGLIFFSQDIYRNQDFVLVFAGLFITGGFTMTFGNLVPAWDSSYYKLLMTQDISYKKYLLSKWNLMVFVTALCLILALPYLYFGTDIYAIIIAGALFNMGLGTWITLFGGLMNKSPIKLNVKAKAFENTQGFSLNQFLLIIPKMILPIFLYWLPATFLGPVAGYLTLGGSGVLGIICKQQLAHWITHLYKKQKHETLSAFDT